MPKFAAMVKEVASPDLGRMGMELMSFTIRNETLVILVMVMKVMTFNVIVMMMIMIMMMTTIK